MLLHRFPPWRMSRFDTAVAWYLYGGHKLQDSRSNEIELVVPMPACV